MATLSTLSSTPTPASFSSELEAFADEAEEEEKIESKQRPSAATAATQQLPPLVRDLRRRLRNRHSSAKFRERQRLRVDKLRAQIAYFEHENRALELRIQQILDGDLQGEEEDNQFSMTQYTRQGNTHTSVSRLEEPLRTIDVLPDDELLIAIQRSFANFHTEEVPQNEMR